MTAKQLAAAGGVLLLIGLLLGLIPGSVSDTVSCGSPWVRDTAMIDAADRGSRLGADLIGSYAGREFESTSYRALCNDALDTRGVFGGVLAGFGVLTLLGMALVNARRSSDSVNG